MPIVDRPVEDEPEEKPDQLGRALIRIRREHPDQWREVYETPSRATAVRIEGCLIGRGDGRIAGASDIEHWEARVVERIEDGKTLHAVRVRYSTKPHGKDWRTKPRASKPKSEGSKVQDGWDEHVDTKAAKVGVPKDPEELAQAGLDLAAG